MTSMCLLISLGEELVLAPGVALDVLLERLVLYEHHVGHEHHEHGSALRAMRFKRT